MPASTCPPPPGGTGLAAPRRPAARRVRTAAPARILDLAARIPPPDACKHIAHLRRAEPISLLKKERV